MPLFDSVNQPKNRGRPKGSKNKIPSNLKNALPEVIDVVAEKAKGGDITAASLLFKYGLPSIKPVAVDGVDLGISTFSTLEQQRDAIRQHLLNGNLTPDEARARWEVLVEFGKDAPTSERERREAQEQFRKMFTVVGDDVAPDDTTKPVVLDGDN